MRDAVIRVVVFFLVMAGHAAAQSTVRFGVLGLFHPGELELSPAGAAALRVEGLTRPLVLNGETGKRRLILRASGDRILVSDTRTLQLRIIGRDGSPVRFQLAVPGKLRRVYEGKLIVTVSRGELVAVVSMDLELAVGTIVASEMPADAPSEALKAQAVATRSFLGVGPRHTAFDFCDTTHCQYLRSPDEITPRVRAAVKATRGQVLSWRSRVVPALYASRCGGQTRTLRDAGMDPGNAYPYYSVACAWCRHHPVHWQTSLPSGVPTPDPGNEHSRIVYARQWGWGALPGNTLTVDHNAGGTLISGQNVGHGIGLCQFGAIGMASEGADFRSILAHYYPNTELTQISPQAN
jgi:peptidoglycan hydrolase-like amidase